MEVTLLNPEQIQNIFKEWGNFACECYATDKKYAERVGQKCFESEHFSGSRTEYFKFKIEDIDRGVMEQALRHEIGVRSLPFNESTYDENPSNIVKNMKSFRYVDMKDFKYTVPKLIENNKEAKLEYDTIMKRINLSKNKIIKYLTDDGIDEKQAIEDANFLLPRATQTSACIAFTLEALIHYLHKRLCTRSQTEHVELATLMRDKVLEVLPQLKDVLIPQCEYLLWCPEGDKCCGRKPTKNKLEMKLKGDLNEDYKKS